MHNLRRVFYTMLSAISCFGHELHSISLEGANVSEQTTETELVDTELYETLENGMPVLNSLPGAMGAIFLDLDGGPWPYTEYDLDPYGGDMVFDETEQAEIYRMWQDVATHFAMFDLNVTTIAPDKSVTPTAHVLISPSLPGGSSQTNVYGRTDENARSRCHSNSVISRSTCITHELGHNLGLNHQSLYDTEGELVQSYRGGDEWGRSPFMGRDNWNGVYTHWANNTAINNVPQNDIERIAQKVREVALEFSAGAYTGDGFRPDDFADDIEDASEVCLEVVGEELGQTSLAFCQEGVIERFEDVDIFAFQWFGGELIIDVEAVKNNAAVPTYASSVGLNLRLLNSEGEELMRDMAENPADVFSTLTYEAEAGGLYYIEVSGAGEEADLGKYELSMTGTTNVTPAYIEWIKPYGVMHNGYNEDPDHDLFTNLEEFGLGLDPTFPNVALPYFFTTPFVLTVPMRQGAVFSGESYQAATIDGIQYTVRGSTDLINYDEQVEVLPHSAIEETLPTLMEGYHYYNFLIPKAEGRGFMKIEIAPLN